MKLKSMFIILFLTVLCGQSFAIRQFTTWQELQDSSDFIVWAKVTKIEEVSEGQYKTTFTVHHTYKGTPPKDLSFFWRQHKGQNGQRFYFSKDDFSQHFILFAKQEGAGYSMLVERFMKNRDNGRFPNPFPGISMFYVKELPEELKEKAVLKPIMNSTNSLQFVKWDDIKKWLDINYLKRNS